MTSQCLNCKYFIVFEINIWIIWFFSYFMKTVFILRYMKWIIFAKTAKFIGLPYSYRSIRSKPCCITWIEVKITIIISSWVLLKKFEWKYETLAINCPLPTIFPTYWTETSTKYIFSCFKQNQKRTLIVTILMEYLRR